MHPSVSSNWNNLSSEGMLIALGGVLINRRFLTPDGSKYFKTKVEKSDQYQYLGNCPPTLSLIQQQTIDNKLRLMLG